MRSTRRPSKAASRFALGAQMFVTAAAGGTCLTATRPARADASSWAFVGAGVQAVEQKNLDLRADPTLLIETGLGTSPSRPLVLGGLLRLQTLFGDGTDLGVSLRAATRSFVQGGFGLALDAGPYLRLWGEGSVGGRAALVLGAPFGITLSAGGGVGSHDARDFGAVLGLDFARLTVYRRTGESWFPNVHPPH